jgi:hypothetical protein
VSGAKHDKELAMRKTVILKVPEAEILRLERLLDQAIGALQDLEKAEAARRARCDQLAAETDKIRKETEAELIRVEQILRFPVPSFTLD